MQLTELTDQLQQLVGTVVESKTITGNSIWIWFDKGKTQGIYIDPPWRVLSDTTIIGTSADFPWEMREGESKEEYKARFNAACSRTDSIQGGILTGLTVDRRTTDIRLTFDNGLELSSFTVWQEEDNWQFADYVKKVRYIVSLEGVTVEPIER